MITKIYLVEKDQRGQEKKIEIFVSRFHEITSEIIYKIIHDAMKFNPQSSILVEWEQENADQSQNY